MRRLWAEAAFAFEGKYYRFEAIGIEPKPIQQLISIWVAAGDNENALKRVARLGDGWFTVAPNLEQFVTRRQKIETYARERGCETKAIPSALFATFHLDKNRQRAEEEGWACAARYFDQPRSNLQHLSPFFGTPAHCAQRLRGSLASGLTTVAARTLSAAVPSTTGQGTVAPRPPRSSV